MDSNLQTNKLPATTSMALHEKVFWAISYFLLGTLVASALSSWQSFWLTAILLTLLLSAILFAFGKKAHALLALLLLLGSAHYIWFLNDYNAQSTLLPHVEAVLEGVVQRVVMEDKSQKVDVELAQLSNARVRVIAEKYPELHYGDVVSIQGKIEPIPEERRGYYSKERITGLMSFPEIEINARDQGNPILAALFGLKNKVVESFHKVLPRDQAQFLSGITLGRNVGFSKEFKEKLSITGTTHLVALSGYNISVIGHYFFGFLLYFLSRRKAFAFSVLGIILFVIMTGAEASVVRAGIMGIILLIADQSGRLFVIKNAIAIAAFGMVLFNPMILAFDLGFQLSFVALLGIVYLKPALMAVLRADENKGFLKWRDNLYTTLAAQIAVLPVLLSSFGFASLLAIIPNVLILSFIPLTMLVGLLVFLFSLASHYLSLLIGLIARIFLSYELGIIELFSQWKIGISVESLSTLTIVLYYAILFGFILMMKKRSRFYTNA